MGGVCGTGRWSRDMQTDFWWTKLKGKDHLEEISLHGNIILKLVFTKTGGGFLYLSEKPSSAQEDLCFVELVS